MRESNISSYKMSYNVNAKVMHTHIVFKDIFCQKKSWHMNFQFLPSFLVIFPEICYPRWKSRRPDSIHNWCSTVWCSTVQYCAKHWYSTGLLLARYSLVVLAKLCSRGIIDSWHSTGLLRAQY